MITGHLTLGPEPAWHQRANHDAYSTGEADACVCWHPGIPGDDDAPAKMRRGGIKSGDWPYGPNISLTSRIALLDWTERTGYRLATPRIECFHWLVGKARHCAARHDRYSHPGNVDHERMGALDHPTLWTRDGKPALILGQPYSPPTEEWVERITAEWPVVVEVTEAAPWYGHGTHGVFVTPKV